MKANITICILLLNLTYSFTANASTGVICSKNQALIEIEIQTNHVSQETSLELIAKGDRNDILLQNETILIGSKNYAHHTCQDKDECFTFNLMGSYNDGICCSNWEGSYTVLFNGQEIAHGKEFESVKSVTFGYGCDNSDGIKYATEASRLYVDKNISNPSSLPSTYPTINLIKKKEDPSNKTNKTGIEDDDKNVGPLTIKNFQLNLHGLKDALAGQQIIIFEQRMKLYLEQFFNEDQNAILTIQNKISNFKTKITVTSQEPSFQKTKNSRQLLKSPKRSTTESSDRNGDVILAIRYDQELSYMDFSSTDMNIVLEAPFSTTRRRSEFVNFLKMNAINGGGVAFTDLKYIDMPFFFTAKEAVLDEYTQSKANSNYSLGIIIGLALAGAGFCLLLQITTYLLWRKQKYGKSKEKYEWPFSVCELSEQAVGDVSTIGRLTTNNIPQTHQVSTNKNQSVLEDRPQNRLGQVADSSCPSIFSYDTSFEEIYNKQSVKEFSKNEDVFMNGMNKNPAFREEEKEFRRKPVIGIVKAETNNFTSPQINVPSSLSVFEDSACSTLTYDTTLKNIALLEEGDEAHTVPPKESDTIHSSNIMKYDSSSTISSNITFNRIYDEEGYSSIVRVRPETTEKGNISPSCTENVCDNAMVDNPEQFSNDTFIMRSDGPEDRLLIIHAPPGKLGIILDSADGEGPLIRCLKDGSCLANDLQKGDRIVMVDEEDVSSYGNIELSILLDKKSSNPIRSIVILRQTHQLEVI